MRRVGFAELLHALENLCLGALAEGFVLAEYLVANGYQFMTSVMMTGRGSNSMLAVVDAG